MPSNPHLFAIFYAALSPMHSGRQIHIVEPELVQRLLKVLRRRPGDQLLLFNNQHSTTATVVECQPKGLLLALASVMAHQVLMPALTVAIGVPKKNACQEAIYSCAAMGVQDIWLVKSAKADASWLSKAELERLQRIIIAAREQAKSFTNSQLHGPLELTEFVKNFAASADGAQKIIFEKGSNSLYSQLPSLKQAQELSLLFGPEAGLLDSEISLLEQHGFRPYALTPTTLRTQEAVTVAVGLVRSLL